MVFVCLGIFIGIYPIIYHDGKNIQKNHGLPEFASSPPLESGLDTNSGRPCTLIHKLPCRNPCRFFIHKLFLWAFRPSPPSVKWTWTVSTFSTNENSYIAMVKDLQPCVWSVPKSVPTCPLEIGHAKSFCIGFSGRSRMLGPLHTRD